MDYDLETAALLRALKQTDTQKATTLNVGIPENRMVGGRYVAPQMGEMMNAFVTPEIGRYEEQRIIDKQRAMSQQQQGEYDTLLKQLNAPVPESRTVLKQALRQGEGPLMEPNIDQVETQVPLSEEERAMAQHGQRMDVGGKMMRLPMARALGEKLVAKGADFPEQLQQLKMKQIEAGNLAAQRAHERAGQQANTDFFKIMALGNQQTGLNIQQQGLDLRKDAMRGKEEDANEKAITAETSHVKAVKHLEKKIMEVLETPNLSSATGAYDSRMPFLASFSPLDKSTAQSKIKNLQELLQTNGLEALRRAGISPGSVTEREWPKFAARAANIDPNLSDAEFTKELNSLLADVRESLVSSESRLGELSGGRQAPAGGGQAPAGGGQAPAGGQTLMQDPISKKVVVKVDMGNGVFKYFER